MEAHRVLAFTTRSALDAWRPQLHQRRLAPDEDRDKKLYRHRCLVEVFFHSLKSFRRIATRYEKTARNDLAMVHLACALQWIEARA